MSKRLLFITSSKLLFALLPLSAVEPAMLDEPAETPIATEESIPAEPAFVDAAQETAAQQPEESSKVIIPCLNGIVLAGDEESLLQGDALERVSGVYSSNLKEYPALCKKLQNDAIGQPLDTQKIQQIKREVSQFFENTQTPFVTVTVPKQRISSGVLQLVVMPARVGEVKVEGARDSYKNITQLKSYIHLKPGDEINVRRLESDLHFINKNPFRVANIIYAPGTEPGTTDLTLAVDERRSYRVYAGVNNTGMDRDKRQRFTAGFSVERLFYTDSVLSYQYTGSYNIKSFSGNTAQFIAYLPWEHMVTVFGGFSTVKGDLSFPATNNNSGWSGQASGRYIIPTTVAKRLSIDYTIGFDYKLTNNSIEFSELFSTVTPMTVALSQIVAELEVNKDWNYSRLELTGEFYWSPGEILPCEQNSRYQTIRPGAINRYVYTRGTARFTQRVGDFSAIFLLRGQFTTAPLLQSEQYGIGGYDTVRGYDERQLSMDDAIVANVELRTPPIPVISMIRRTKIKDSIQFLFFCDYGWGKNKFFTPGESSPLYLLSVGPGLRYTLDPYLAARVDWGWKLKKEPFYTGGDSMVQFGLTMSY